MDDLQFWPSWWLFIIPEELVKTKGLSCQLEETEQEMYALPSVPFPYSYHPTS